MSDQTLFRVLETKAQVLENQDLLARALRRSLYEKGVFFVNLMASPGAGKTTTLVRTIEALRAKGVSRIGVIEADADGDVDAGIISETGTPVVQVHTGGSCHMDVGMTRKGLEALLPELKPEGEKTRSLSAPDKAGEKRTGKWPAIVFLENIGNLVCPAEFDVGAHLNAMILSTPEGHDKPLKYPLMFEVSDCLLVNKMDVANVFDFDLQALKDAALQRHPGMEIFPVCAMNGEGFDAWIGFLLDRAGKYKT